VNLLGLAGYADFDVDRGQEATPLIIEGVMYVSIAWSNVRAFDAKTGKPLWFYDAKVPRRLGVRGCCDAVNRGVAAWKGKIFVGTFDGRLVALDAKTGQPVWSVMTVDPDKAYTNRMAPRVIKRVMIGVAGSEYDVRGYISAYDAETGALAWRFYTVPGDPSKGFENEAMEMAAKTWHGEWWKMGGGGTVWVATSYDPELNLIYFGAGNGSVWNQHYRSDSRGDNLFLSSIIALNADTGAYVWHYQALPGEEWIRLVFAADPARGIAPCSACHGPGGYKLGARALQHQRTTYIESQLLAFAQGMRQNDISEQVRTIARQLTPEEMHAVAAYYGGGL